MKCDNHPDRDTEQLCSDCYKPVCNECSQKVDEKVTCKDCLVRSGREVKAESPEEPPVITEAAGTGQISLEKAVSGPAEGAEAELKCNECGTSLRSETREKIGENNYCRACVQKAKENISQALADMTRNINWPRAILAGFVTAAVGAVIWDKMEIWFNIRLGLIAIAIGYGVAMAVVWGSGGKRGMGLQVISVIFTLAGIIGGLFLSIHDQVISEAARGTFQLPTTPGADWLYTILFFPLAFKGLTIMTWIIIAFGLYQGFVIPAMPKVDLPKAPE